jgi:PIN domain nuclease of toxin-antitoxin system
MKLLLDTHVFLWFLSDDRRLPLHIKDAIESSSNLVHLSVISIWETVIKHSTGKLALHQPPAVLLPRERDKNSILSVPVDEGAMPFLASLPLLHGDPFDRLLVAQSLQHGMQLVAVDQAIIAYGTPVLTP